MKVFDMRKSTARRKFRCGNSLESFMQFGNSKIYACFRYDALSVMISTGHHTNASCIRFKIRSYMLNIW